MGYPKDDSSPVARDVRGGRSFRWDAVPCGSNEAWGRKMRKKGVEDDGGVTVAPDHLVAGGGSRTFLFGGPESVLSAA